MGAGTRNSPIAIDDSEDEVFNELYQSSEKQSPQMAPTILTEDRRIMVTPPLYAQLIPVESIHQPFDPSLELSMHVDKKRKRTASFTSQDVAHVGPSNGQRQNPSLVNRISQPEGKKARKRRRKAERQALEEARLQNINWLGNSISYPSSSHMSALPSNLPPSWESMSPVYPGFSQLQPPEDLSYPVSHHGGQGLSYRFPYETLPERSQSLYNHRHQSPVYPPPPSASSSDWVSSMALAADHSLNQTDLTSRPPLWTPSSPQAQAPGGLPAWTPSSPQAPGGPPAWTPLSPRAPLPPDLPPPMPPPVPTHIKPIAQPAAAPRPVEHHALPSKPPPIRSASPIGVMPDLDPNSKHGTFHITASTKEAGSDIKKRNSSYLPNPARTLVIEQLPKSHRNPDFIKSWSRNACGSIPVHIFIDGPAGKALIEFATAELARKAWASPKLGTDYSGLKPHQLKGKVREDLIKAWWYRVDGVGAGAGVGEIEEGEIEGDISVEKEDEVLPKKETKKERKARLAKEREAKKLREEERRRAKEQQMGPQHQAGFSNSFQYPHPMVDTGTFAGPHGSPMPSHPNGHYPKSAYPPPFEMPSQMYTPPSSFSWNQVQSGQQFQGQPTMPTNNYVQRTKDLSLQNDHDDRESIASSAARSNSPPRNILHGHSATRMDDYELDEEVDMDVDEASPVPVAPPALPSSQPVLPAGLPAHSSLPARPTPATGTQQPKTSAPAQKLPVHVPSAGAPVFVPRPSRFVPPPPIETLSDPPLKPSITGPRVMKTATKCMPTGRVMKTAQKSMPMGNDTPSKPGPGSRVMKAAQKSIPAGVDTQFAVPPQKPAPNSRVMKAAQKSVPAGVDPLSGMSTQKSATGSRVMKAAQKSIPAGTEVLPSMPVNESGPAANSSQKKPPKSRPAPSTVALQSGPLSTPSTLPQSQQTPVMTPPTSVSPLLAPPSTSPPLPPSEPKSMKNAPTEPSFTKRALMARQKELEAKIAQSKMELAAAATNKAGAAQVASVSAQPQSMTHAKPSMDLGEKQAMEDRLRKLVLQSRKPAVHAESPSTPAAPPSTASDQHMETQAETSTVSMSAHSFSLEDMAVSFITQTIETMKSQPASVGEAPQAAVPAKIAPQSDVRSELAAQQQRLEKRIIESKLLMTQLEQARTKSEKDAIMGIIRERTRQEKSAGVSSGATTAATTSNSNNFSNKSLQHQTTTQQFRITRWPGNCLDAGLLIVSDDEDEDEDD